MSPSRRHEALAWAVPRLRRSRELDSPEAERARIGQWHATLGRRLPTLLVPRFAQRFSVVTEVLTGPAGEFASYVVTPRGTDPHRTVLYLHGGGYVAPIDPFHVRYVCRLATDLGARIVLPDYPLAPEHTWRDSHDAIAALAARWAGDAGGAGELVLAGDSAGGGYALAIALTLRDRGGPQASRLLLHSPWVDLTAGTPETERFTVRDPWLFLGKLQAYAEWWAGSPEDLGRPEVSPALADLGGLPPALMFCGTRDTLAPGCRLLARRAAETDWDLTYVEAHDLIHVYPLLPLIPEARAAHRRTLEFLS
ncbi:alpha/beta hydrolase [Nocardioides sp. T2.26MG-1]|uniref:alpha/beta hydrolase n=1 Tax=Nocardioides sp. T2.26MG-1 TaxID=3041166 RepID=UPI002477A688|nr:alpha/beta hydrolase [Nocardioides sp. T2.26MG-1]CAI9400497.1 Acetyl esterase [Nocardioides sp. T2.26MG-1]